MELTQQHEYINMFVQPGIYILHRSTLAQNMLSLNTND